MIEVKKLNRDQHWREVATLGAKVWANDGTFTLEGLRDHYAWRAMTGAFIDEQLVGMWGSYALECAIPGPLDSVRVVPTEGATAASVDSDFRRRGVLKAIIGQHLDDCAAKGAAFTIHGASEPGIYGRFGYAPARWGADLTLGRDPELVVSPETEALAASTQVRTEYTDPSQAARLRALGQACATHLGSLVAEEWHVARDLKDHPESRRNVHAPEIVWATRDGVDVGAALMSRKGSWNDCDLPDGKVTVRYMVAADQGALVALVRRICGSDLMASFEFRRWGYESPLAQMLPNGPRNYGGPGVYEDLWLRIVDVAAALELRGYASACDVVLEVTDSFRPSNAGRWRLTVGDDGVGRCVATEDAADVSLDIWHLGAAYLGQRSLRALAQAGTIVEHRDGALFALSQAFLAQQTAFGGFGF